MKIKEYKVTIKRNGALEFSVIRTWNAKLARGLAEAKGRVISVEKIDNRFWLR